MYYIYCMYIYIYIYIYIYMYIYIYTDPVLRNPNLKINTGVSYPGKL